MVGGLNFNGVTSRNLLPPQKIDGLPGNYNSKPSGQMGISFRSELAELSKVIPHKGEKKILEQIFNDIRARLNMIKAQSLLDCIVGQAGILADQGIPGGFLPF